jgi:phenylacetate-CoA ligase
MCSAPNFAVYVGEKAPEILGAPARELGLRTLIVGGEPGGGIPTVRARLEEVWGATCAEVLGNSDIATLLWAECEAGGGMHFIGHDMVLAELIDPDTESHIDPEPGATGELVYSALRRQASALLRFRSNDRVEITNDHCECGRTSFKLRCFGRTDDMLLVRGINVWPSAVQDVITGFRPRVTGLMRILVDFDGHTTQRPLHIEVECAGDRTLLADDITKSLASRLVFSAHVVIVEPGTLTTPGAAKVALVQRTAARP